MLHQYKICSICLVVITFQFVLYFFAIEILHVQDHRSKVCLSSSRLARTKDKIVFSQRGSLRSIVTGFTFFTHVCDCSVKTELIYRNNCAKNNFNRLKVGAKVYRQFSTTFAFLHSSGQWTRGSEDWVSTFCKCQHHQISDFVPFFLWAIFTNRVPLFLRSRSKERPLSCSEFLCIERYELSICLAFFLVVLRSP